MIHGIGVDIVEVARIKKAIERWGENFLSHVFTEEEIAYSGKHKYPEQHFAVRFAAKEAVYKAIGDNHALGWKDICITNDINSKPCCQLNKEKSDKKILISLSHTENYAVANAIALNDS